MRIKLHHFYTHKFNYVESQQHTSVMGTFFRISAVTSAFLPFLDLHDTYLATSLTCLFPFYAHKMRTTANTAFLYLDSSGALIERDAKNLYVQSSEYMYENTAVPRTILPADAEPCAWLSVLAPPIIYQE